MEQGLERDILAIVSIFNMHRISNVNDNKKIKTSISLYSGYRNSFMTRALAINSIFLLYSYFLKIFNYF